MTHDIIIIISYINCLRQLAVTAENWALVDALDELKANVNQLEGLELTEKQHELVEEMQRFLDDHCTNQDIADILTNIQGFSGNIQSIVNP